MNRSLGVLVSAVLFATVSAVLAQIPNVNLANSILGARQKNGAMLVQYTWTAQTQISKDGSVKDTRIQQVSYGPDGAPKYVLLNDTGAQLPRGFLRRAIADNEKEELEKYLKGLEKMIGQYTLPSPGAIVNFLATATITSATSVDGTAVLQTNGKGVVTPGDTLSITFDAATFAPRAMEMTTTFDNQAVNMSATFRTMPSGLNHMQYATIDVPGKALVVQVHNYDYVPNN